MKKICKRTLCALLAALMLCACAFSAFGVNEHMKNARWKSVTGSEAVKMLENGDTFVLYCYRTSCGNSKSIGANVLIDWMDVYGKDVYGVDVDASDGVPSFVWTALGKKSATLPFVAFVRAGEVTAFSTTTDLKTYADLLNDTFFAFYTDVTRVGLAVVTPPDKTVYNTGEPFDTTGLTLEATYADGTKETVTEGFACSGFSSDTAGHRTVTVTYKGMQTTFVAAVNTPDGKPSVWVEQPAKTKLRYGKGTTLTVDFCNLPDDMRVEWTYSFRTIHGIETHQGTGKAFSVTAKGYSQTVAVNAAVIAADGSPIRTEDGGAVTAQHKIRFQNNIFFRLQYFFEHLFDRDGCGSDV